MPCKVRGVGHSRACAVGIGSRQSSEGTSWANVMPVEGLKLIRKRMFGSQRWDALNFLQANRICIVFIIHCTFQRGVGFSNSLDKNQAVFVVYQRVGFFPHSALLAIH